MPNEVLSQQELYEIFKNEVQNRAPSLTDFEEGSNLDALGGAFSVGAQEVSKLIIDEFAKTFFSLAEGAVTEGDKDDLEFLAVDHFGENFRRPQAANASVNLLFTRPDLDEGAVVIPEGTIVKTEKDINGVEFRFQTTQEVTMGSFLQVTVPAIAIEAGTDSNVAANRLINIETSLVEPDMTVTNQAAATGGAGIATDAEYRAFITNQIETLRGATCPAIEAAAENVPGVEIATMIERIITVTEFDELTNSVIRDPFKVVRPTLYIADSNGTATQVLIDAVDDALFNLRACGIVFEILGATPLVMDWRASYTLNPGGPNFAELNSDPSSVEEFMVNYIKDIPIASGFDRIAARQAVLDRWGPSGTNDLTDFLIADPTGNISGVPTQKLVPGVVEII